MFYSASLPHLAVVATIPGLGATVKREWGHSVIQWTGIHGQNTPTAAGPENRENERRRSGNSYAEPRGWAGGCLDWPSARICEVWGSWRAHDRRFHRRVPGHSPVPGWQRTPFARTHDMLLLRAGYAYVPYSLLESVIEPDWQPWVTYFLTALKQQLEKRDQARIHLALAVCRSSRSKSWNCAESTGA